MATWTNGKTETSAVKANYCDERIDLLEDYYGTLIDSGKIRAAGFLLGRNGKVFANRAAGKHVFTDDSGPAKPDAIKRMASITKVFTATAAMKLVEDGKLWLEQPVKSIIKEFDTPMHGEINLQHLLTHTSGLPADGGYFCEPYPIDWFDHINKKDWIKRLLSGPLQAKPGSQWNYSTLGFAVVGELITRASGMPMEEYIEQNIYKPLGMTRSFFNPPEALKKEITTTEKWEADDIAGKDGKLHFSLGGFGAYASLPDLFRFAQSYLNGGTLDGVRILGRKTVEAMTRNQLDGVPSFHWSKNCINYRQGLGWGFFCDGPTVSPECYNHEGWGWCSLFIDPKESFVFASYMNTHEEWDPDVMVKPRTIAFSGIN